MDWGTVGVLAGVVTLEGFRRLPPGGVVLRRPLLGHWSVAASGLERGRWALVAWWPPLFCTVVLSPPPPQAPAGPGADLDVRLARLGPWRLALDLLGTAVLVGLLVLLPLATGRFGSTGFLAALALVFVLAGVTSTVAAAARRGLGLPRRPALAALSPFAASQAGERLLEHALATVPRLAAARALLPAAAFQAWLRVAVYDATEARDAPDAELEAFLTPALTTQILDPPDRPPGADRYCPRCGASYHTGEACCDCAEVRLVAFAS